MQIACQSRSVINNNHMLSRSVSLSQLADMISVAIATSVKNKQTIILVSIGNGGSASAWFIVWVEFS